MLNADQLKSAVRWLLTLISGAIGGWLLARNILTAEQLAQVSSFLTSEAFVSLFLGVITLVWGWITHTASNTVASAAKLPEVLKVEMMPTPEGAAIKEKVGSTPKATVTVAGKVK